MSSKKRDNLRKNKIKINAPWGGDNICNVMQQTIKGSDDVAIEFLKERSRVHESFIKEEAKNKRLALILSALLFISALLVVMFAPSGREEISYWLGGTLLLFSASAAGYKRLWAKAPLLSFEAGNKR